MRQISISRTFDILDDTLDSLHYCKLPGSMLDLFSKQFELLTRTIDDFESNMAKRLYSKTVSPPATSAVEESLKKLAMQILSLEGKIYRQSSRIADIEHDLATMSQENKMLREEMQKLVKNTAATIEEKNQHLNQILVTVNMAWMSHA